MEERRNQGILFDTVRDGDIFPDAWKLSGELLLDLLKRKVLRYNRDGSYRWNICGFISILSRHYAVFPKTMTVWKGNETRCAKILMRTLYRYRNSTNMSSEEIESFYGDGLEDSSMLGLALFLFDDYRRFGLINRRKDEWVRSNKGAASWSRTVSSLVPVITHGNAFYDKPYVGIKSENTEASIRKIHKFVLGDAMSNWGWIEDFEDMELFHSEALDIKEAIRLLRTELRVTYQHREILLIKNMISYLSAKSDTSAFMVRDFYYTASFHAAWEKICGYLLSNRYESLKSLIPPTSYIFEEERAEKALTQIPDILSEDGNDLFIFDAKYYDKNRGLPEWKDVMKQYIYRLSITKSDRENTRYENTYNAFLIPQNEDGHTLFARVETYGVKEFGRILVYGLSSYQLLKFYAYNDKAGMKDFREKLMADVKARA